MEIREIVHEAGGLLYYDGANLNAIMDKVRPGDMGFDAVHLNLQKHSLVLTVAVVQVQVQLV